MRHRPTRNQNYKPATLPNTLLHPEGVRPGLGEGRPGGGRGVGNPGGDRFGPDEQIQALDLGGQAVGGDGGSRALEDAGEVTESDA
jgi:hypothetical protein